MKTKILLLISFAISVLSANAQCRNVKVSGPITATSNGQIIQNVFIKASGTNAITVNGKSNVTIRNCKIEYQQGFNGIKFSNSPNIKIENVEIFLNNAPARGKLGTANSDGISGFNSNRPNIQRVKITNASSGIRITKCNSSYMRFIEGYNFRGPFPRGQLIQFDTCRYGTIEDFFVFNDPNVSYPEDNINFFKSGGQVIRRGVIDGNNAPNGVGILWEDQNGANASGVFGGLVEDVDIINVSNGAVSGADGSRDIIFKKVRVKNNKCTLGGGRGKPSSNALVFSGYGEAGNRGSNLKLQQCQVFNLCNPTNVLWPATSFSQKDYKVQNFNVRKQFLNNFQWCISGSGGGGGSTPPVVSTGAPIGKYIWLRKTGGDRKYVSANPNGVILVNGQRVSWWEKFRVDTHPKGGVALRAQSNGKYLQVIGSDQNAGVKNLGNFTGDWEQLQWKSKGSGKVAFKSVFVNKWLQASHGENNGIIRPRGNSDLPWETFDYAVVAAGGKSLNTEQSNLNVKLYPNPAQNKITISGLAKAEVISIYSLDGSDTNLSSTATNGQVTIGILSLSSGIYFAQTNSGNTIRFVKE